MSADLAMMVFVWASEYSDFGTIDSIMYYHDIL